MTFICFDLHELSKQNCSVRHVANDNVFTSAGRNQRDGAGGEKNIPSEGRRQLNILEMPWDTREGTDAPEGRKGKRHL